MFRLRHVVLFLLVVLGVHLGLSPGAMASTVVFSDSTFNDSDWDLTVIASSRPSGGTFVPDPAAGSSSASQQAAGGIAGPYRQVTITVNALPSNQPSVQGFHRRIGAVYTPSTQGAIDSIACFEHFSTASTTPPIGCNCQGTTLGLRQGGVLFYATPGHATPGSPSGWVLDQRHHLHASDFCSLSDLLNLSCATGTSHPDFSASGGPIDFGFWRGNSGDFAPSGYDFQTVGGIDNWQVHVFNHCPDLFSPHTDYATGALPTSLGMADLNLDGKIDIAVADRGNDAVSVLLGNGTGGLGAKTDFTTGDGPTWVAIADLNGDGKLDLATANQAANTVSSLLGNGNGTFGGHSDFATGMDPTSLAVADLNANGRLDLAVANQSSASVSVLLGNGAGGFGAASDFTASSGPFSVAISDLNIDGKLDIAVTNVSVNTVSVLLGLGGGSFGTKTDFATGNNPFSVAAGDLNGDARPDLVVANEGSASVSVMLGDGTGNFGPKTDFATGNGPASVGISDFDGNGKPDLATSNFDDNTVSVLFGDGAGGFIKWSCDQETGTNPQSIAIGDLNADGKPDVATVNYSANTVSVLLNVAVNLAVPRVPSPSTFMLGPVMPNPSRGVVRAPFALSRETFVQLRVVDVLGRNVVVLASGLFPAGPHEATWDGMVGGRRAPTGVYFMSLEADGKNVMRRVVLAR